MFIFFCSYISKGQTHSISLNNGYSNQSFFSLSNGEISNVSNDNWDLALLQILFQQL